MDGVNEIIQDLNDPFIDPDQMLYFGLRIVNYTPRRIQQAKNRPEPSWGRRH